MIMIITMIMITMIITIVIKIMILIAPILATPREAEGRDLDIHCTRRGPTLVPPHSLVELGRSPLAFISI